jgi:ankyrin repeat protein
MADKQTKSNINNTEELSPELLIYACQNGYLNITKNILESGNINPSLENNSALVCASSGGYTDIVKLLLEDKRINICDNEDYKCFYTAIENQHMMTAILILGYILEKKEATTSY